MNEFDFYASQRECSECGSRVDAVDLTTKYHMIYIWRQRQSAAALILIPLLQEAY